MADIDPASLNFIKLKKWLVAAGCPKSDVDACTGKEQLMEILPKYYTGSTAAAAPAGEHNAALPVFISVFILCLCM